MRIFAINHICILDIKLSVSWYLWMLEFVLNYQFMLLWVTKLFKSSRNSFAYILLTDFTNTVFSLPEHIQIFENTSYSLNVWKNTRTIDYNKLVSNLFWVGTVVTGFNTKFPNNYHKKNEKFSRLISICCIEVYKTYLQEQNRICSFQNDCLLL